MSKKDHDFGDIDASWQASQRKEVQIERFRRSQRQKRDWINFAEIADWFTDLAGPQKSTESTRADVYRLLQQDILEGDFEEDGRSTVRLLHARLNQRIQSEYVRSFLETFNEITLQSNVLPYCWIPRRLFQQWCAKHHLPVSSPRFQPKLRVASPAKAATRTGGPGKPSSMHLIRQEFHARAERNATKETLQEEASALKLWLTKEHPSDPQPTTKTIKNNLRHDFRLLKGKRTQK
jgi:hypothetical protein